jgi:hypothetical protein
MSDLRKAAEMALEALEGALSDDQPYIEKSKKAASALRQALAEAEQKEKDKQHLVSILSKHIRIDPDTGNVGIGR